MEKREERREDEDKILENERPIKKKASEKTGGNENVALKELFSISLKNNKNKKNWEKRISNAEKLKHADGISNIK